MEVLTSPTIGHVTVVTEAGWLNPVVSLVGVVVTAIVTWGIARRNLKQAEARAKEEQGRHVAEIERLEKESTAAEERHGQQIDAMLKQGRREREVRFLRELADYVFEFSVNVRDANFAFDGPDLIRLRQYGLNVHADFSEDDDAFAYNVAYFLEDLANRTKENKPISGPHGYWPHTDEIRAIADDAEKCAFYLLRWLNPRTTLDISKAFERYRSHGTFDELPATSD